MSQSESIFGKSTPHKGPFLQSREAGHVLKMFLKNIPKRIHLTPAFFPKSMSQKDICGETNSCCSPEGIFFFPKSDVRLKQGEYEIIYISSTEPI